MYTKKQFKIIINFLILSVFLSINIVCGNSTSALRNNTASRNEVRMRMPVDPSVQRRSYFFKEANENIEYLLFVSSKVKEDKKNPLIVTLHGRGIGPEWMFGKQALDLAEKGGYILVGPMGYRPTGYYGVSMKGYQNRDKLTSEEVIKRSEQDIINVLEIICKEFSVDDRRIYLMGHSMGGAGTLYLGVKYAERWAALGAIAPATYTLKHDSLASIKHMPVIVIQGDRDIIIKPEETRLWADKMKELNMNYEYIEIKGADHGGILNQSFPLIFDFFAKYAKAD